MLTKPETPTKEDPRIQRTRKLLTQAMGELLGEKSFQSITVSEITARATLNRVTFYAHFRDKYDLFEYFIREQVREQIQGPLEDHSGYTEQNLRRLVHGVAGFLADMNRHSPPPHGQLQPLMERQVTSELYELLLKWLNPSKKTKKGPLPKQVAMVTSWAIYGAATQWSLDPNPTPLDDFVSQVLPLLTGNLERFTKPISLKHVRSSGGYPASSLISRLRLQMSSL